MFPKDTPLFARDPDDGDRRHLLPCDVKSFEEGTYTIEIDDPTFEVSVGEPLLLYYEKDREFMQQAASMLAILESDENPVVAVELDGDPISAEQRQCYRVRTVSENLTAAFGDERTCPLQDVSAVGFGVIARNRYRIGDRVPVVLHHDGQQYEGTSCVQSIRDLDGGQVRYGAHCLHGRSVTADLERGLRQIAMTVQRQQLRRLSGAG